MRDRCLALMGAPVVVLSVSLASVLVSGQGPTTAATTSAAANTGSALKTPWGEPDLQGIWASDTVTPLERPAQYAGREFLTEEEMAALDKQRAARTAADPGRDRRAERGTEQDVAGAYNAVWSNDGRVLKTGRRTSQITDPPDGRIPALTQEVQKRIAAQRDYLNALLQGTSGGRPGPPSPRRAEPPPYYNLDRMNRSDGPEDRSSGERCLGSTLPTGGGFFRIVQSPGSVGIYYDIGQGSGFSRFIAINGSPHLPQHIRQYHGDARGRWEGDTLVVDITNFSIKTDFQGSRENLHLIERYTRVDSNTLRSRVTVEDPTTFTRPWTFEREFAKQNDRANLIFEGGCHEGNYGLVGMLANTRAAEKLFKEGRGPDPATQDIATGGMGSALPPGVGRGAQ